MFRFAKTAAATLEAITRDTAAAWRELVHKAIADPSGAVTFEQLLDTGHHDRLTPSELLHRFEADCLAVEKINEDRSVLADHRKAASKCRKPTTIQGELERAIAAAEKLRAELDESEQWHDGAIAVQRRIRNAEEASAELFVEVSQ